MSIWFTATISLNPKHVRPDLSPKTGILRVLNKHGLKVEEPHSEMYLKNLTKEIFQLGICNPDGYVDEIHNALKALTKHAFISGVHIDSHYYF